MGRHEIDGFDGTQRDHRIMPASITRDANAFHGQKHGECLTGFVVPTGLTQLFDEDVIRKLQCVGRFARDFTENAHAETGARKWVSVDHLGWQTELDTDAPNFIFEKLDLCFNIL